LSTTVTDKARLAASDPWISSLSAERGGSNKGIRSLSKLPRRTYTSDIQGSYRRLGASRLYIPLLAKSIPDCQSRLDFARRGRYWSAGPRPPQLERDGSCNGDALRGGGVDAVGAAHPIEHGIRHADARHFVRHELRVACALERKHAGDDREPRMLDALEHAL